MLLVAHLHAFESPVAATIDPVRYGQIVLGYQLPRQANTSTLNCFDEKMDNWCVDIQGPPRWDDLRGGRIYLIWCKAYWTDIPNITTDAMCTPGWNGTIYLGDQIWAPVRLSDRAIMIHAKWKKYDSYCIESDPSDGYRMYFRQCNRTNPMQRFSWVSTENSGTTAVSLWGDASLCWTLPTELHKDGVKPEYWVYLTKCHTSSLRQQFLLPQIIDADGGTGSSSRLNLAAIFGSIIAVLVLLATFSIYYHKNSKHPSSITAPPLPSSGSPPALAPSLLLPPSKMNPAPPQLSPPPPMAPSFLPQI